jgi:hypothetical protein
VCGYVVQTARRSLAVSFAAKIKKKALRGGGVDQIFDFFSGACCPAEKKEFHTKVSLDHIYLLQHDYFDRMLVQFSVRRRRKKNIETLLAVPKRWQIQSIWILGIQEIVLFVLGDVLCLISKFSLRLRVYSAHLDPQSAGVCPVYFG